MHPIPAKHIIGHYSPFNPMRFPISLLAYLVPIALGTVAVATLGARVIAPSDGPAYAVPDGNARLTQSAEPVAAPQLHVLSVTESVALSAPTESLAAHSHGRP